VTCNNNDLPFIPGDNGWTRINIDLLLDRTKGTATMNVSLNGTNTIKDKVFQPHVLPPNGASTPPINVNVGTNYLVGPLGETNYLIDNVIIDHR
jgi:hypothetical protein